MSGIPSTPPILCYGAYGYTGELTARLAAERGIPLMLAGRNADKTAAVASRHSMEHRVFGLDDPAALDAGIDGATVVIHCAGPFSHTAEPMVQACIRKGIHYLDITGEAAVFKALSGLDEQAKAANVMVMPGAGFDVVPSDCLAAYVAGKVEDATHLTMGFSNHGGGVSHGTATTIVENIDGGTLVRRDGKLVQLPMGVVTGHHDFGDGRGAVATASIAWGDVVTAWLSTGIANIEVFIPLGKGVATVARISHAFGWLTSSRPVQSLLKSWVNSRPAGPTDEQRQRARSYLFATASNAAAGTSATAYLKVPEGYTLTADLSLRIAERVVAGDSKIGYQTASMAYGPDLILDVEGTERRDG